jgi:hypothetical protein
VLNHGGTHLWARRMGVRWVHRPPGSAPYWTEERVRERLSVLLDGRSTWPTPAELEASGPRSLLSAVRRHGGVDRWAAEFGVERPQRARASSPRGQETRFWSDEQIRSAISPLVEELGRWPTKSEFRRAGLLNALSAVYYYGGSGAWQRRLGVSPGAYDGPLPDRTRWNDQMVERELRRFCEARSDWPTLREFYTAGRSSLYRAASRRGGIALWRQRLGFE